MFTYLRCHLKQTLLGCFILATACVVGAYLFYVSQVKLHAQPFLAIRIAGQAMLLVCFLGAAGTIIWLRQQVKVYRRLYELERACQDLENRYGFVMQNANEMIMIVDAQRKIIEANQRALTTYGYTREEMIGLRVEDLRSPETRADVERQFAEAVSCKGARFETLALKKDGTVFPIESSIGTVTIGGEQCYVGIVRDISERKRAESEVLQVKREWEEIFQAVGNPAFILTPDNGVVSANRAMQQALGMSEEEIRGKKCYELLHRSEGPPEKCPLSKMIASCQTETSEMEVEVFNGTYQVTCTPMFDSTGRLVKAIHIAADITELKAALRQAEESRQRFLALAMSAQDAIIITDDYDTIVFWNPAAERMFGFSADELMGKSCEIYMPDDVKKQYRTARARFHKTGMFEFSGKTLIEKYLRKDGSIFPVEVAMFSWQEQGKTFFARIVRDITEREKKEQQIQQQLAELRQWQRVTVGREERIIELKQEVNELLEKQGLPPRYSV